jgi:hypothetical protein
MSAYSTYTCMECSKHIAWGGAVQKCKVCHMDLCDKCYGKHNGVCIWCYQHAPDQYVKMKKATSIAMLLMPAIILFMPAPMPAVLLVATNPNIVYSMLIYGAAAYITLGIMRSKAVSKLVSQIPADAETLDERQPTEAVVQAQTLIGTPSTVSGEIQADERPLQTVISNPRTGSRVIQADQIPLQAPAATDDLHGFDIEIGRAHV